LLESPPIDGAPFNFPKAKEAEGREENARKLFFGVLRIANLKKDFACAETILFIRG
jgi:hypothetical protein